jgi:hypothetical protein
VEVIDTVIYVFTAMLFVILIIAVADAIITFKK